ncbi:MAG: UDP-N-acetylmuramoyl-L-alanine--D-glutamate ligase [Candidatus Omnitrophota bacterium]
MDVKDKKITVIGLGESGRAAALLLKVKGAVVYATDSASSAEVLKAAAELRSLGINVETGAHTRQFLTDSQFVVISPGVPPGSLVVKWAKEEKIDIIGEIELASWFCKGKIVAVTGTNGKSTTVTLIAQILKDAGKKAILCGNVGNAFCNEINKIDKGSFVVLEVSSFQLEYIKTFKPFISVILNISQNHFDRHKDLDEYFAAKRKIYQNQTKDDYCLLNYDDKFLKAINKKEIPANLYYFSRRGKTKGAYEQNDKLYLNTATASLISSIKDFKLKQPHNIENFLAASLCAFLCGVSPDAIKDTITGFEGLEHRAKVVATINGVSFIDDSKATTVESTCAALRSINASVVLIAGGRNKGSDFSLARDEIGKKVKALILIGEARHEIKNAFSDFPDIREAATMDDAVNIAAKIAKQGEAVLLSPMCASFDMFKDYKHRGEVFKQAVQRLLCEKRV